MDLVIVCSLVCKCCEVYYLPLSTNSGGEHFVLSAVVLCTNAYIFGSCDLSSTHN